MLEGPQRLCIEKKCVSIWDWGATIAESGKADDEAEALAQEHRAM